MSAMVHTPMIRLDNWSVVYEKSNGFTPPENLRICLKGTVTGHPRKADGTEVTTSAVVSTEGRTVTTSSGSVYELGEVAADYLRHVEDVLGRALDEAQPVKVSVKTSGISKTHHVKRPQ